MPSNVPDESGKFTRNGSQNTRLWFSNAISQPLHELQPRKLRSYLWPNQPK
ncbi:hypothetical protein [Rhizobium sp. 1399]|uniref:hypothetical protein n=1 Tax=Rhizobium sp. 1399 TaxID=2817758 RepID=UPI002864E49C|nr:hypothetical protein [Rhizobium sp. 1399]MDR6670984.1 hypothetical protein [Rhizobium sp. 1399]